MGPSGMIGEDPEKEHLNEKITEKANTEWPE